jgi:hypothetical protein
MEAQTASLERMSAASRSRGEGCVRVRDVAGPASGAAIPMVDSDNALQTERVAFDWAGP